MIIEGKKRCINCFAELSDDGAPCSCGFDAARYIKEEQCLSPGTILNGMYCVGRVIGEGGFGITYSGFDVNLELRVAIKEFFLNGFSTRNTTISNELNSSYGTTKETFELYREKFINEARTLAKFNNEPGIVSVMNFFKLNNTAYIIMEYLDGMNLKEYVKKNGTLTGDETVKIFLPIIQALDKVHQKELIHRDISPDNIIFTKDGKVKLLDFGATREVANDNKSLSVILKHGFSPMEQYQSHGAQGPWTDVYALCATMYKCITGETPPEATDRAMGTRLIPPCELSNNCSRSVSDVIVKGMELGIKNRYQSMKELENALSAAKYAEITGIDETVLENDKTVLENNKTLLMFDTNETIVAEKTASIPVTQVSIPAADQYQNTSQMNDDNQTIRQTANDVGHQDYKPTKKTKKIIPILIAVVVAIVVLIGGATALLRGGNSSSSAADKPAQNTSDKTTTTNTATSNNGKNDTTDVVTTDTYHKPVTLNVWSFADELPSIVQKYIDTHPGCNITMNSTIVATTDGAYQPALDNALRSGGTNAPDIYAAEAAFVFKYTQGDACQFAMPYEKLGIDVNSKLKEADIAQYTVDIGRNPQGKVVGLGYQATGGAFIYRRSIAQNVWGTDNPNVVAEKIGAGSGNWNKFFSVANELSNKGYAIISGDGDMWHGVENSSDRGWIVSNRLYIDSAREAFLDYTKTLFDYGYCNYTSDWTDDWFADMKGEGRKEVFGFFGPAWLITYTLGPNCGNGNTYGDWAVCAPPVGFFYGGSWVMANSQAPNEKLSAIKDIIEWITLDCTENGLQYMWANGTMNGDGGTKDCVASGTVMALSDGRLDFLGGQNMFDVFIPVNQYAKGNNLTQYDEAINALWRACVLEYALGDISRDDAIKEFRQRVYNDLGID